MPGKRQHTLSNKSIFIFPTKFGFVYLVFVLLLFLLGTNYQNNVIILLSYLLSSLFITCMMHSFYNFSGLQLEAPKQLEGYTNQSITFGLEAVSNKSRHNIIVSIDDEPSEAYSVIKGNSTLSATFFPHKRGQYLLPRVKISSEYALGLFTTWTRLDFACLCTVFPSPKKVKNINLQGDSSNKHDMDVNNQRKGIEDFYELKTHQEGEPLSHIAWKQFARGQGKFTKHYQEPDGQSQWLDLARMPAKDIEDKLSIMCYLVLELYRNEQCFGLQLGSQEIAPSSGNAHLKACLTALALFGNERYQGDAIE